MSLKKTKEQLIRLLAEADSPVIALSGKWGTGKTHLWNEVRRESSDSKVNDALYVSLFGLASVDQIKRKLIEAAIPGVESHDGLFDGVKDLVKAGVKALSTHYKALAAISDLNVVLMSPLVLRDRVLVIDDIERKHEKLGIDEVLGFIDEYSKQYRCRFILVLNDDQLSTKGDQQKLWTTFREKVIDQEIRLSTSAEEAFSIASGLVTPEYPEALKHAVVSCGLTNIRVVVKVIKVANRILAARKLEDAIQKRVIPSIVLFSAIHYRGLDDGPDFNFALGAGNYGWLGMGRDRNAEPTEQEKREDRWRLLMQELGIQSCDEFERLLVDFLESGLFDAEKIKTVVDGYEAEKQIWEEREIASQFLKRVIWDHRADEAQLVAEASGLPALSGSLDAFTATELDGALRALPGGAPIGQAIIDGWIAAFKLRSPTAMNYDDPLNRPLHPAIKAEFAALEVAVQRNSTVIDACRYIIENSGWGSLQEAVMRQATASDFETAIREMEIDELPRFMRRMIEMRLQRGMYDAHFGSATERFVEACRAIATDAASPRLGALVKRLFDQTALASELAQ